MNLEEKTRTDWRNVIDQTLATYLKHPEDDILEGNFNGLQMMYKQFFGHWYRPKLPYN